jgi:hypothetical protein
MWRGDALAAVQKSTCSLVFLLLFSGLLLPARSIAGSLPESDASAFDASRMAAEVEVLSSESYLAMDQTIRTRYVVKLLERFKAGKADAFDQIEITSPGGTMGHRSDARSDSLTLEVGKSYVLLLDRAADGTWSAQPHHAFRAPANRRDVRDFFRARARGKRPQLVAAFTPEVLSAQANSGGASLMLATTGYTEDNGQPTRFSTCDGDDQIPYLIDIDPTKLPTGMTQQGAVAAVAEAVGAWAAPSSLKFRYEGTQSFGCAASSITTSDRRLRIQLHDNNNAINTSGVLGLGGGGYKSPTTNFTGGRIGTQGYQERLYGFVMLESTSNAPALRDAATFKRVLTHEIGHALGLAHSSENPSESNAALKNATMYYSAPSGTSGATIQTYDVGRIQFGYPVSNTPPYTPDRILIAITTHSAYGSLPTGVLGVNRIQLRATDGQGTALSASMTSSTSNNGTFVFSGTVLTYTPSNYYGDSRLTDAQIEGGSYNDQALVQFSDGVNLSRAAVCSVVGFAADTTPSDGLPDSWMIQHFGTKVVGALGSGRHPDDDPDHDGLSNRIECYLNTNPMLASSGPVQPVYQHSTRRVTYTPLRYASYRVESSSTLASGSWTLRRFGTRYQESGSLTHDFSEDPVLQKEFYRVVVGP